jgi:aminoglycoside phosphotransferase (APT) family kinase protein
MSLKGPDAQIDLVALARWMDGRGLGSGPIEHVTPLGGGTQNVLLRFSRGGEDYVLRHPPPHPRPESNEVMRREARVLGAIDANTDGRVPHPRLIAACAQEDVLGGAFYLMAPVDGVNVADAPRPVHCEPAVQHRMGIAMAEGIAALGEIDPVAAGLGDFGKVEGFLTRQSGRWRRQLDSYAALEGWPGAAAIPGVDAVERWLEAHCPASFRPGILHGDYHLSNVMFRPDSGELAAIIDWEMSTIGDPLLDLGWMIATWAGDDGDAPIVEMAPWNGFPKTGELVDAYACASTRSVEAVDWYVVLACYKLGIILEGTYARACAGLAERETGESLHASTIRLFERALARI